MKIKLLIVCLLAALIMSCSSKPVVTLDKSQVLIDSYKAALQGKNSDQLMALVYWEGVEMNIRQMMQASFNNMLGYKLNSITFLDKVERDVIGYELNGIKYTSNLKPVGELKVVFDLTGLYSPRLEIKHLIGVHNDIYMITTAAPVKKIP